jgi:hypothetical protein
MNYYTYAYLREDKTPYYIGKGKRDRIYSNRKRVKPPKDKSRIIFLKQNLTEEEAFKHERYMIAVFGRKDLGTGILHNMTDGGEGTSNRGTPEQRSEIVRKAQASRTPEQRSEVAKKGRKTYLSTSTPEQRSEAAKKAQASRTPEQRSEIARKANASRTPEQRREVAKKAKASMTPEQRSEAAREAGRKTSSIKWQCTVTGFIANAGNLAQYQKARGIDTSNRIRLS